MAGIVTGEHALIKFSSAATAGGFTNMTLHAFSDFSLTFDRGTVEQELCGQKGNYFKPGAMSIEGSLTACRFGASGSDAFLDSIIDGTLFKLSGTTKSGAAATDDIGFFFHSCQCTGYDVTAGDASTISEATIDFTVLDPYNITYASGWIQ